jgi:hypothetical protein
MPKVAQTLEDILEIDSEEEERNLDEIKALPKET